MTRIFTYNIDMNYSSIEEFLRQKGYSHHIMTHLKRTERGIVHNGDWAYSSAALVPGDRLVITLTEDACSENIVPAPVPFEIVYEDEDLMIINKPSNTPVHPSVNNYGNTLANGLAWHFAQKKETFVYRCINRLDRDTSGLLIIARHALSAALLSSMVASRKICREYLAVAAGSVPDCGTIDAPIAREAGSAITRCVDFERGERAVTHYKCLSRRDGCSLVRLRLETGRTHQIRVHMKYLGYPLLGDYLYNPDYRIMKRQALHSARLSFDHPVTGIKMDFTAPLPDDMEWIMK